MDFISAIGSVTIMVKFHLRKTKDTESANKPCTAQEFTLVVDELKARQYGMEGVGLLLGRLFEFGG